MIDISSARQRYVELRQVEAATEDQLYELVQLCQELKVPKVTLYMPYGVSWWRMYTGYVFTERTDIDQFVWYYSPRQGELYVYGPEPRQSCRFEEWDANAQFFTDPRFDEGITNVEPFEREKNYKA